MDYKEITKKLLEKSTFPNRKESAVNIINNKILITDKSKYQFKYLIDCSGVAFFLRNKFNFPKPFRYWIAIKKEVKRLPTNFDKKYYYNFMDEKNRYLDEFLYNGEFVDYCKWQNTDIRTVRRIKLSDGKMGFITNVPGEKIVKEDSFFYFPANFVFPLVYKNYAFLGDSFGNTPPQSGFGVAIILKTSKILANAIKNNILKYYSKQWLSIYSKIYLKYLTISIDRRNNSPLLEKIKKYPPVSKVCFLFEKNKNEFFKLLSNDFSFKVPKEVRNVYPKRQIIFLLVHYLHVRSKYLKMKLDIAGSYLRFKTNRISNYSKNNF